MFLVVFWSLVIFVCLFLVIFVALFLSTYLNKVDKKGRVSVPAQFRSALRTQEFSGIIVYTSFINECIEGCGMDRIEKLSESIDNLDPYSEERDAFATAILASSHQLSFDGDGRVILPELLIKDAKIDDKAIFVGKGKTFEIWNPDIFEQYSAKAMKIANEKRAMLRINNGNNNAS